MERMNKQKYPIQSQSGGVKLASLYRHSIPHRLWTWPCSLRRQIRRELELGGVSKILFKEPILEPIVQ